MNSRPIKVFYSYSRKDESFRDELAKHLSAFRHQGLIEDWHDRQIDAGENWDDIIRYRLEQSDLILFLISPDFLASDYCYGNELELAFERHRSKKAKIVPILLRPIDWKSTPLKGLKPLPTNHKPISTWKDSDEAYANVAKKINKILKKIQKGKATPTITRSRINKWFSKDGAKKTPESKTDYTYVSISCPTCGQGYHTTVINAGATFRCRNCGCTDKIQDELNLLIFAIEQKKVTPEILNKVAIGQMTGIYLTPPSALLLKSPVPYDEKALFIDEKDIVEPYRLEGEADLTNGIFVLRLNGLLGKVESELENVMSGNEPKQVNQQYTKVGITYESMPKVAKAMVSALLSMASKGKGSIEDFERLTSDGDREVNKTQPTESYRRSRILCLFCKEDTHFGNQLSNHLEALVRSEIISRIDKMDVDTISESQEPISKIITQFHIVIVLLSPDFLASDFSKNRALEDLLSHHQNRDIVLLPVITRPMAWRNLPIKKLQVLPPGGEPLSTYSVLDAGCATVVEGIHQSICKLPLEIIVKVAERSDVEAMNDLWVSYALGQGVIKNEEKMVEWLQKAATKGREPSTMYWLGFCLKTRDPSGAAEWMTESAEQGLGSAMLQLAYWYESGECVEKDIDKAFQWMHRSAVAGDPSAMIEMARMLYDGIGTTVDHVKGTEWLIKCATEKGNPIAMAYLADAYKFGRGVERDDIQSQNMQKKAASSGDEEALRILREQGYLC